MREQFLVTWEGTLEADPETVWHAITEGTAGWLWGIDYEPREGGTERGLTDRGAVTRWQPPRSSRRRPPSTTASTSSRGGSAPSTGAAGCGWSTSDWPRWTTTASRSTPASSAPTSTTTRWASTSATSWAVRRCTWPRRPRGGRRSRAAVTGCGRRSGSSRATAVGRPVRLEVPGLPPVVGEVDYHTDAFLGVLADNGLYRFCLRDHWGWPVGVAHHVFDEPHQRDRGARRPGPTG